MNPTIKEWLFAREMMRRLGFAAEDIFFTVQTAGIVIEAGQRYDLRKPAIALELRTQGRTFVWTIGGIDMAADKIEPAYQAACDAWNRADDAEFSHDEFFASRPFQRRVELVHLLHAKGFRFQHPS